MSTCLFIQFFSHYGLCHCVTDTCVVFDNNTKHTLKINVNGLFKNTTSALFKLKIFTNIAVIFCRQLRASFRHFLGWTN